MDKTELYIKMSDCPEIFNECKFQGGDWFHADGKSWMAYEFNEKVSLEEHRKHFEGIVFLPRQDDIQGMLYSPDDQGLPHKLTVFWMWADDFLWNKSGKYKDRGYRMANYSSSWEQLWLAFYMYEKHSKIWSSKEEKWVKK